MHSTNYYNTFIEIAEDCPTDKGEMPPLKGEKKSVANLQFEMLYENPYVYTSDEVLFGVFAQRKEFTSLKWTNKGSGTSLKASLVLELPL